MCVISPLIAAEWEESYDYAVSGSSIYAALLRPASGLYSQSSGYVYSLLKDELSDHASS